MKGKNILFIILGIFLVLGVGATPILDGIHNWRTDNPTESFSVTTGAGVTSANVTLASDLFQDKTSEVVSITSNITGESPIASAYTAATNVLLVAALNPSATHTIAVDYYADSGNSVMGAIGPWLGVLIIGAMIVFIIWPKH